MSQVRMFRISNFGFRISRRSSWLRLRRARVGRVVRARGRLALLLADVPARYPERFLATEELPDDVTAQLREAHLRPGPELKLTNMPPAPLEFSLGPTMEERWVTFSRSTFYRASASWLMIASVLGLAWFATR